MSEPAGRGVGYDDVPYDSVPAAGSHPARLAAVGAMMGLRPPAVERCRVLELGCGVGTNTLPIAADLPDAEVVGVDLSARQVERATGAARALGLGNVRFLQRDLAALGDDLGRFDYVIAHGVYSWVPAPVRDALFAVCDRVLTDDGLAYVSYNTYPGWHYLAPLRDLLRHHVRAETTAAARVAGVGEAFALLADGITARAEGSAAFLREHAAAYAAMLDGLGPNRDASIHHDILADINQPVYLRELVAHAAQHGLRHVGEAGLWLGLGPGLAPEVHHRLAALTDDLLERAQYLDFLTMRTLRQSVLCRASRTVATTASVEALAGLCVGSALRPVAARPDLRSERPERFASPGGAVLSTSHPVAKAGLCHLAEQAPRLVPFAELVAAARARLGWPALAIGPGELPADAVELAKLLVLAVINERGAITLATVSPSVAREPGERPRGRAYARWQLAATPIVTSHLHEPVALELLQAAVLQRCDGAHDRSQLVDELVALASAGTLAVSRQGKPVPAHQLRSVLTRDLEVTLGQLASLGLLTA